MVAQLARAVPSLFLDARPAGPVPPTFGPPDLATAFACLAEMVPLLVVLDDLRWAIGKRCSCFAMSPVVVDAAVLILAIYGEDWRAASPFARITLAELTRHRLLEPITIGELSGRDIDRFVEVWCGTGTEPELVASIGARTSGNPYLLEEVLRQLTDTSFTNGAWHRSPEGVPRE